MLYDRNGHRKYLTPAERADFLRAAGAMPPLVLTFCSTLVHGGCRISEALALTADRVDPGDGVLVFESLKKRRKGVFRAVPVPPDFLGRLRLVHDLDTVHQGDRDGHKGLYHINAVDEVTQWEIVAAGAQIPTLHLLERKPHRRPRRRLRRLRRSNKNACPPGIYSL